MNFINQTIKVPTSKRNEMIDITSKVAHAVSDAGITDGTVTVYCPHTTAAVTINENADPDVTHDILMTLEDLIPKNRPGYRHCEGNSDSHVKSSIVGCSETVMISQGKLILGTWQAVFFCEFDGPRTRKTILQIQGE